MIPIVYNLEPFSYSSKAEEIWITNGYNYIGGNLDDLIKFDRASQVEILIIRLRHKIDSSILSLLPNLKTIITATTGLDHIDNKILYNNDNIKVYSLKPHMAFLDTIPSTAEHTWSLIMSIVRNVPSANNDVVKGNWDRDKHRGIQLKGKTIGIIGMGRTGIKVANYARAFDMEVVYYDPNVSKTEWIKVYSILELAKRADIVSVHVHLQDDTINLIDTCFVDNCKDDVFIINTSRGKICDELALVNGLRNKKIKGIATDVLSFELINIKQSKLWLEQQVGGNIIITPHLGGATWEAMWECEEYLARYYFNKQTD